MVNILFVDDSATMRKVATLTFAKTQYQLGLAQTFEEAKQKIKENAYQLILLDVGLLSANKDEQIFSLCAESSFKEIFVLLLENRFFPHPSHPTSQESELKVHLDKIDFFAKPFEVNALLQKVQSIFQPKTEARAIPTIPSTSSFQGNPSLAHSSVPLSASSIDLFPTQSTPLNESPEKLFSQPFLATDGAKNRVPIAEGKVNAEVTLASSFVPRAPLLKRAPVPETVIATLERMAQQGGAYEGLAKLSKEEIEKIVRELVSPLLEDIIRQEVRQFLAHTSMTQFDRKQEEGA